MQLPLEVIAGPAEVAQPQPIEVGAMDGHQAVDGGGIHGTSLLADDIGQRDVAMHYAVDMVHQVELHADHVDVVAQRAQARHRHRTAMQRRQHACLAIERVG